MVAKTSNDTMVSDKLKRVVRHTATTLSLTPMHRVLRRLEGLGIRPAALKVLEVFGCDGEHHTRALASAVGTLHIWEHDPRYEPILRRRFPQADIRITDSYAELARTQESYDMVVVDNSLDVGGGHHEHFDVFPAVFRTLNDPAIVVLNLLPAVPNGDPVRLRHRRTFYEAADPGRITFDEIENTYRRLANANGWEIERVFFERRWQFDLGSPRSTTASSR